MVVCEHNIGGVPYFNTKINRKPNRCNANPNFNLWLGNVVVRTLDVRLEIAGSIPADALSSATVECNLGQVVHTHCPTPLLLQPYGAI